MTVTITNNQAGLLVIEAGGTITPFTKIDIVDTGSSTSTETITVQLPDPFSGTISDGGNGTFNTTGRFTELTTIGTTPGNAILHRLIYTAPKLAAGTGLFVHAVESAPNGTSPGTDSHGGVLIAVVTAPNITNTGASTVAAGNAVHPFAGISILDQATTMLGSQVSATITITEGGNPNDLDGQLTGTGIAKTGLGTYSISATSVAQLVAMLQQLTYTTAAVGDGQTKSVQFDLKVTNTWSAPLRVVLPQFAWIMAD